MSYQETRKQATEELQNAILTAVITRGLTIDSKEIHNYAYDKAEEIINEVLSGTYRGY